MKTRCLRSKFLSIICDLEEEKLNAIRELGFGGLLQLACKELRYKLFNWLITRYDVTSHTIMLESAFSRVQDSGVGDVIGIQSSKEASIV